MPFGKEFNDTYKFGIKGAAEQVGAYAERVDEQMFDDGILDRIFNQINKADVIVADLTGRNPNVFYEVGYAHALNKIVILLTQRVDDIPFDLKHRQHVVYGGEISTLKDRLAERLNWAVIESRRRLQGTAPSYRLTVFCGDVEVPELSVGSVGPLLSVGSPGEENVVLRLEIRNEGDRMSENLPHIYLLADDNPRLIPGKLEIVTRQIAGRLTKKAKIQHITERAEVVTPFSPLGVSELDKSTLSLSRRYRIHTGYFPQIPPGAVEPLTVGFRTNFGGDASVMARFSLRIHRPVSFLDFPFQLVPAYHSGK
jgi:hypothetical protein